MSYRNPGRTSGGGTDTTTDTVQDSDSTSGADDDLGGDDGGSTSGTTSVPDDIQTTNPANPSEGDTSSGGRSTTEPNDSGGGSTTQPDDIQTSTPSDPSSSSPSDGSPTSSGGLDRTRPPRDRGSDPTGGATPGSGSLTGGGSSDDLGFLEGLSQSYTRNIAEPVGTFSERTNPAAQVEQRVFGTDAIGSTSFGIGKGVAQLGNVPGALLGARRGAEALDDAAGKSFDPVTIGGAPTGVFLPNPQGQEEVAKDTGAAAARAGAAAAQNPFETAGVLAGSALGGVAGSRGVSRALSRIDNAGDSVSGGAVSTGREQVGTGGRGSILDADAVDEARGITGPSRRSRLSGEIDRTLDEVFGRFDDSALSDFVDDTRGQLQRSRSPTRDTDFSDAPDRTRPADAGGTFEDIRQDSLTQTQDALRDQARRPDLGDYDGDFDPVGGSNRGPIFDPDSGDVSLQRTTGSTGSAPSAELSSGSLGSSSSGAAAAGGAGALGEIATANDLTGIAPPSRVNTPGTATDAGINNLFGASNTGAGTQGSGINDLLGTLERTNDPTDVDPGSGTASGVDLDPGSDTDMDTDTGTDVFNDGGTDFDIGSGSDTDTGTRTGTDTDVTTGPATSTPPAITGTPPKVPIPNPPGFTDRPPQQRTPNPAGRPSGDFPDLATGLPRDFGSTDDDYEELYASDRDSKTEDRLFSTGVPDPGNVLDDLV